MKKNKSDGNTAPALGRREVLTAIGGAATLATLGCTPGVQQGVVDRTNEEPTPADSTTVERMPSIFLPHGGGPWPWTPAFTPSLAQDYVGLRGYLEALPDSLPHRPTAIIIVSAHWQAPVPTLMTSSAPPMLYDYSGFPADTYTISWPAPGNPDLVDRVQQLLGAAGIETGTNPERGYDHGTFVPLKLAFPQADIPTLQLSLDEGYDPERHLAMGRALAPLRDEGMLIIGSGMSWENFRSRGDVRVLSNAFDEWFQRTALADQPARDRALSAWTDAPHAREAHPHEEHLLPMMVAAGAAGSDVGQIAWSGSLLGMRVSAVHFGDRTLG